MSDWSCPRCRAHNTGRACEDCGHEAVASAASPGLKHCDRCDTTRGLLRFHDDTRVLQDRGALLCPACWIPALKRRAEADPPDPGTVRTLLAELQRAFDRQLVARAIQTERTPQGGVRL